MKKVIHLLSILIEYHLKINHQDVSGSEYFVLFSRHSYFKTGKRERNKEYLSKGQ